jgi:hypothetical protein
MKKVVLGSVSALALMLVAHGPALAGDDNVKVDAAIALQRSEANVGPGVSLQGASLNFNQLEDQSFQNATGAFNVNQNAGPNSAVQTGMAIGAVTDTCKCGQGDGLTANAALAASSLEATVSWNGALGIITGNVNNINDQAFQNAKGAFNIAQNTGANSAVQASMSIATVTRK